MSKNQESCHICIRWLKSCLLELYKQSSAKKPTCKNISSKCNRAPLQYSNLNLTNYLFSLKNSCPCRYEPGTSQVPSRYATNWAILAWIVLENYEKQLRWWRVRLVLGVRSKFRIPARDNFSEKKYDKQQQYHVVQMPTG